MFGKDQLLGNLSSLTLAADARFTSLDYTDDQIWELQLSNAEPLAPVLRTSYGLRAKNMRIFFLFQEGERSVSQPRGYYRPVQVEKYLPNYLALNFLPYQGIKVVAEYWILESNVAAGRIQIYNLEETDRKFSIEIAAILNPAESGSAISSKKIEGVNVLQGLTGGLSPIVFSTGGPMENTSPYISLLHKIELRSGQERKLTWVHAALANENDSFNTARSTATKN